MRPECHRRPRSPRARPLRRRAVPKRAPGAAGAACSRCCRRGRRACWCVVGAGGRAGAGQGLARRQGRRPGQGAPGDRRRDRDRDRQHRHRPPARATSGWAPASSTPTAGSRPRARSPTGPATQRLPHLAVVPRGGGGQGTEFGSTVVTVEGVDAHATTNWSASVPVRPERVLHLPGRAHRSLDLGRGTALRTRLLSRMWLP